MGKQELEFAKELVCVRLLDEVENGKLKALHWAKEEKEIPKYGVGDPNSRFTLHFSLNYPYGRYFGFNWANKNKAVLIPLESLLNSNQIPINIHSADTFFLYEINLPDETIILEQPDLSKKITEEIQRKGFEFKKGGMGGWKPGLYTEDKKKLRNLAKQLGSTYLFHCDSTYGRYESLVGEVKNWKNAVDFWNSDNPEAIKYYKKQKDNLKKSYHELKDLLPNFPEKSVLRVYAEKVMKEFNDLSDLIEEE